MTQKRPLVRFATEGVEPQRVETPGTHTITKR